MQGFPLIPRAELSMRRAGRGSSLILKDEWRPNQRSLSFFPPPRPRAPLRPYPAPLPRFLTLLLCPRAPTPIYACEKPPAPPPSGGRKPGAFSRYLLRRCLLRCYLKRCPLMLRRLLCLGRFVAGEHRCGCGQFGAGHECGAEGCELACVAFGYAEQGQQLGGGVGHNRLQ